MPTLHRNSDVVLTLVAAPGESNGTAVNAFAIDGYEKTVRNRNPVTHDELVMIITAVAASPSASAIVQALGQWLNGRNGRRYRIKKGDSEFEAPSMKELEALIKLTEERLQVRIVQPPGKLK